MDHDDDVPINAAPTPPTRPNTILAWSLRGLDELDHFPTDTARDQAMVELGRETGWRDFALGLSAMAVVVVAVAFGGRILMGTIWPGAPSIVRDELRLVLTVAAAAWTLRWLHRRGAAHALREKLLRQGVAVCVACGQNLRGLRRGARACPECGAALSDEASAIVDAGVS